MKDEIKEILDKLKDNDWYEELDLTGTKWIELTWEETHLLLDYITNLQEENKRLQKLLDFEIERNDIKQETIDKAIEMIKNEIKEVSVMLNSDIGVNLINSYMEQYKLLNKYLNILQGSDKDE